MAPPYIYTGCFKGLGSLSLDGFSDLWKHKGEGLKCSTCMWCCEKEDSDTDRCRRHAPTMQGYPLVYPEDWCGDHKVK